MHRYLAFGSSMDYMYQELHVAYPLTVEVHASTVTLPAARAMLSVLRPRTPMHAAAASSCMQAPLSC